MPTTDTLWKFEQLMSLNRMIFETGQFEGSYHCLAAAYHVAIDANDLKMLQQIVDTAREQSSWIDTNMPQHPLSSFTKRQRPYGVLIYSSLATMAKTRILLLNRHPDHGLQSG